VLELDRVETDTRFWLLRAPPELDRDAAVRERELRADVDADFVEPRAVERPPATRERVPLERVPVERLPEDDAFAAPDVVDAARAPDRDVAVAFFTADEPLRVDLLPVDDLVPPATFFATPLSCWFFATSTSSWVCGKTCACRLFPTPGAVKPNRGLRTQARRRIPRR
jgi:hypothetical protein